LTGWEIDGVGGWRIWAWGLELGFDGLMMGLLSTGKRNWGSWELVDESWGKAYS
jgi:hypothetical protein